MFRPTRSGFLVTAIGYFENCVLLFQRAGFDHRFWVEQHPRVQIPANTSSRDIQKMKGELTTRFQIFPHTILVVLNNPCHARFFH